MAWTAPMTAVPNDIFKASDFNTYIRDNLLETAPGLPDSPNGSFYVTTGENSISGSSVSLNRVDASASTASTTYTDLSPSGPSVTLTVNNSVVIGLGARMTNSSSTGQSRMSVEWSNDGVTNSASDNYSLTYTGTPIFKLGNTFLLATTPGQYTFTAKYRVSAGTGTFQNRTMLVFPF